MREINRLSIHQWLRSAIPDSQQPISPIGFLFLKLPRSGPLLEVKMSKKCTPLWREAHSEVKSVKNWRSPTIWTDEKQSRAEGERRERLEERRSEKRKSQKKEDADARKGRQMICGSGQ